MCTEIEIDNQSLTSTIVRFELDPWDLLNNALENLDLMISGDLQERLKWFRQDVELHVFEAQESGPNKIMQFLSQNHLGTGDLIAYEQEGLATTYRESSGNDILMSLKNGDGHITVAKIMAWFHRQAPFDQETYISNMRTHFCEPLMGLTVKN